MCEPSLLLLPATANFLPLPHEVFQCPICGAPLVLELDCWELADDGSGWQVAEDGGVHPSCTTEPDLDDDAWEAWHDGHYSMPYGDWIPLDTPIRAWINARYRWNIRT